MSRLSSYFDGPDVETPGWPGVSPGGALATVILPAVGGERGALVRSGKWF